MKSGWRNCGSPVCYVGLHWSVIITGCELLGVRSTYTNRKLLYFSIWHNEKIIRLLFYDHSSSQEKQLTYCRG